MKRVFLATAIFCMTPLVFGADKTSDQAPPADKAHIQMHEQMAKSHQQAADCLKAGKPADECRKAFQESCHENTGGEACGPMKHHRQGKRAK